MLRTANIIGSGPNGLAAAITLAQHGVRVRVYERTATIGGACTTGEVTLPGFHHDLGASAFPLGIASSFFLTLGLERYGLRWLHAPAAVAHPFDDGTGIALLASLEATAAQFAAFNTRDGDHDAHAWQRLMASSVRDWPALVESFTQPLTKAPRHPVALATFGVAALWPAQTLARSVFRTREARALFAGCAAHSVLPLTRAGTAATALVLIAAAHTTGWPVAAGGATGVTQALVACLEDLGGELILNSEVTAIEDLPHADVTLFDTGVGALRRIARRQLTPGFDRRLAAFRAGAGISKIDYALSAPIPWRDSVSRSATTVHAGGTLTEVAASEAASCTLDVRRAHVSDAPFLIVVQPSVIDPARAPAGCHTAWAYCHVPSGYSGDASTTIERQLERFAPGFAQTVLARHVSSPAQLSAWDANLAGGDVSNGAMTLTQLVARPTLRQYRTSHPAIYLCSAATPPGGGVHGMCGHNAAMAALKDHAPSLRHPFAR